MTAKSTTKSSVKAGVYVGIPVFLLALLAYWLRPLAIIHAPLWVLDKYETLWVWPTIFGLVAALPVVLLGRGGHQRRVAAYNAGGQSPRRSGYGYGYSSAPSPTYLKVAGGAFLLVGFVSFLFFAIMIKHFMAEATYKHYSYTQIAKLPEGGTVRIIPREVAQGIAESSYQTSGHTLKSAQIVFDSRSKSFHWSFEQGPTGLNTYKGSTVGIADLSAEQTDRTYHEIDRTFKFGPSMKITDSVNWQFRKRHYFGVPTDPVPVVTPQGEPVFIMPWITYSHDGGWLLVKYPKLGGVMVFHANGHIDDLSPTQAAKIPYIAASGRIMPEGLAREIQNAYAYKHGISNVMFTHHDQTNIQDDPQSDNHMPYLMSFAKGGKQDPAWVSVAEPKGRAFASSALFLTSMNGTTQVWRAPKLKDGTTEALTGPNRAIQLAKSRAINGIVYAQTPGEQGRFTVVEPRPVFIKGRLYFLLSIIPSYQPQQVTKSVIVDAQSSRVVAVFNHDSDPTADSKLIHYLKTGELDQSAAVGGQATTPTTGQTPTTGTTGTTGTTPGIVSGPTVTQIQAAIDQNQKLQAALKAQRAQLEAALKAAKQGK